MRSMTGAMKTVSGLTLAAVAAFALVPLAKAQESQGDAARGRQVFAACRTCHYPEKGFGHHNGPSLYGIFGRKSGSQPGFRYYSETLKRAGFVWTPELLDAWLANPGMLPGSTMIFVGLPDARDRADLIAYLSQFRD